MNDPIQVHPKYVEKHKDYGYVVKVYLKIHTYYEKPPIKIGNFCDHRNNGYTFIKDEEHLQFAKMVGYRIAIPIFIHESSYFEVGDLVYNLYSEIRGKDLKFSQFFIAKNKHKYNSNSHKVIVQNTNINPDFLNEIEDSRHKDLDQFYIRIEKSLNDLGKHEKKMFDNTGSPYPRDFGKDRYNFQLKLNDDNYVEPIPLKKTVREAYIYSLDNPNDFNDNDFYWFRKGFEGAIENYELE